MFSWLNEVNPWKRIAILEGRICYLYSAHFEEVSKLADLKNRHLKGRARAIKETVELKRQLAKKGQEYQNLVVNVSADMKAARELQKQHQEQVTLLKGDIKNLDAALAASNKHNGILVKARGKTLDLIERLKSEAAILKAAGGLQEP